jgi:hypothetical protein
MPVTPSGISATILPPQPIIRGSWIRQPQIRRVDGLLLCGIGLRHEGGAKGRRRQAAR